MEKQRAVSVQHTSGNITCDEKMLRCCMCERLLEEPQQLSCLHNCCRSCLQANSTVWSENRQSRDRMFTLCPICDESSEVRSNSFINDRVRIYKVATGHTVCGVCDDKNDVSESKRMWCMSCRVVMCATCLLWHENFHKTHRTVSIEEMNSNKDSFDAAPLCSTHQKPFVAMCFSCKSCSCEDCWAVCGKLRHDVNLLSDVVVTRHCERAKREVAELASNLLERADALSKRKGTERDLGVAFEYDLGKLKERNRQLISAITAACSDSERCLIEVYKDLRRNAADASRSTETVERKIIQAAEYSQYVLLQSSETELLNQENDIVTRLQSLSTELRKLEQLFQNCASTDKLRSNNEEQLIELVTSLIRTPSSTEGSTTTASNLTANSSTSLARGNDSASSNEEDILALRGNSNTQVKIVLPAGTLSNPSAMPGTASKSGPGSKLVLENNESAQICMTASATSAILPSTSGGETIIKGNKKLQLYTESGSAAHQTNRQQQGSTSTKGYAPSHVPAVTSPSTHGIVSANHNRDSQVMITGNSGSPPTLGHKAEGNITINKNTDTQVMIGTQRAEPVVASNTSGAATTAATTHRHPQSLSPFLGSASPTVVHMSVECSDISVTCDGRLLLAAGTGMLECNALSGRGEELARWQPTEKTCAPYENSWAVEALSVADRAAVGITDGIQKPVVLLRRRGDGGESALVGVWVAIRRLVSIPSIPDCLAAHGDALATATQLFGRGSVEVMSISRREQLVSASREYGIESVAVTDKLIVSVSETRIKLDRAGREAQVVDAHSRVDGRLMWRYQVDDGTRACDVCTDSAGDSIYVAAVSSEGADRLVALSAANGRELCKNIILVDEDDELPPPLKLSMRRMDGQQQPQRTLLAVLCDDKRTVAIHSSC